MFNYRNIFDNQSLVYSGYRNLISDLLAEGKTTGSDHSEALLHYTKMNLQRMNRVEKTTVLSEALSLAIANVKGNYHFLVISEGWCGDAAQIVPVIEKIVSAAPDKFDLKLVLRDQHLPLIDANLTNGGRAIPVLLILDEDFNLVMPKWGPRPLVLQELMNVWKTESSDMMEIATKLHSWYAKDKTKAIQHELLALVKKLT